MNTDLQASDREVFDGLLSTVKQTVDAELERLFTTLDERTTSYGPEVFATVRALRDLTMRGGKRFRPAMLAAAYLAVGRGDDVTRVTQAAVALELLQAYFLIHDDWMDQDSMRRGGPTVHAALHEAFGSEHAGAVSAVLAGDLAVSLAQVALATQPADAPRLLSAQLHFAVTQLDVVFGQLLDVHATALSRADVERMHALKTTSYTVTGPVIMGAALAGADGDLQAALRRYTEPLGLAFQLRDDLLGTFGDPRVTGKPVGNDIRLGKRTALVLELLDDPKGRAMLAAISAAPATDGQVLEIVEYMIGSGARARVERRLDELLEAARSALATLDLHGTGRRALFGAIDALGARSR